VTNSKSFLNISTDLTLAFMTGLLPCITSATIATGSPRLKSASFVPENKKNVSYSLEI
jgi:hypothetical protein